MPAPFPWKPILLILACSAAWAAEPDGAALYRKQCAACHESPAPETRAPDRRALRAMTPAAILASMETGSMKPQAESLSAAQRRAIADFLAVKTVLPEMKAGAGFCPSSPPISDPASGPRWLGWGVDPANTRFQPAKMAGLTLEQVPRLKLKWAFGYAGATNAEAHPTVVAGRLFIGSPSGEVYSLDAATGCIYWSYKAASAVRSAINIGPLSGAGATRRAVFFGDMAANVYAVDAATGTFIWKTRVDEFPTARITGSPQLHAGRLYVPVSSVEEVSAGNPNYPCCKFRGSVVALDARTGNQIWKTYTIPDPPQPTRKKPSGVQLLGPSGAAVWSAPTLDLKRKALYIATGNSYSDPPARTSDAILAIDMDSGSMLWSQQMTPDGDAWNFACMGARSGAETGSCPEKPGGDFDFGSSPILKALPAGKSVLVCGQKSGFVHALDPDRRGEILWQVRVGRGSALGGVQWGPAADEEAVYVAVSDVISAPPEAAGGLFALRLTSGEKVWHTPAPKPPCLGQRGCSAAQSAAVTAIPGVVFSGSMDGHLRAFSTKDGSILWDFDTLREFATANGVKASGGSLNGPGPTVAGGMVYVNSGYARFRGLPGNVLLAFSVDGK